MRSCCERQSLMNRVEIEEMKYQEAAEALSIPIGTVMSRLARARKTVRESVRNAPGGPRSGEFSHQEFF